MKNERILVISAHALDYLWRCGGTIAKYTRSGSPVKIIDLTCGARGESNALWKRESGINEEQIISIRQEDARKAARILGAEIQFMNWQDHMIQATQDRMLELAYEMVTYQPTIVLTHFTSDPMNPDHPITARITIDAYRCAQTSGVFPGIKPCSSPKLYMFEPAYPETVGYVPDVYINISDTMNIKMDAMLSVDAQRELAESYDKRNGYRGHLAAKLSGNREIRYAETFQRFKPYVGDCFC